MNAYFRKHSHNKCIIYYIKPYDLRGKEERLWIRSIFEIGRSIGSPQGYEYEDYQG